MNAIFLLCLGFVILIKGADWLVDGACSLAKKIRISELTIGLTIVAFGTSMPELFVNIFASLNGDADIAVGNVLGSNIFNILLILGVSSMIYPLAVTKGTVKKEIPFSLVAALLLWFLANDAVWGKSHSLLFSRQDGIVFLIFFVAFIFYLWRLTDQTAAVPTIDGERSNLQRSLILIGTGFVGLVIGAKLVEKGAVNIAEHLGVSQALIGLTIVAAGTSLPELATSAVAAYKKNSDIAVGNIVGSNIFNIFFILGVSSAIKPLPVNSQINADILILLAASLVLFLFMFTGKKKMIDRWEGAIFVFLYICYIIFLIMRG